MRVDLCKAMDPQLDLNALIRLARGEPQFVAFGSANQVAGLTYNSATRVDFRANGVGSQADLNRLERAYGVTLLLGVSEAEIDASALRLQAAFRGDPFGPMLRTQDARIIATGFLKGEAVATCDLQLFKRAVDLGVAATFLGSGRGSARALAYAPRPVSIPGGR